MRNAPLAVYSCEVGDDLVCLVDLDGERSVTNDAEAVVAQLVRDGIDFTCKRLVYRDTMTTWDEILVRDGRFAGFNLLNAITREQAVRQMGLAPR